MDKLDLRIIVKGYLDRRGMTAKKFAKNMPGEEWATSFMERHKDQIAERMCQNIKRSRAAVSPQSINEFFDNLNGKESVGLDDDGENSDDSDDDDEEDRDGSERGEGHSYYGKSSKGGQNADDAQEIDESDESDDEPLAKKVKRCHLGLQKGDFVIIEYDGELLPGQVTAVGENGCDIRSMEKSGINWKWPKLTDEMFYVNEDIKQKIQPPKSLKRGVLEVAELKERWQ